jgi:hypothetical protein
MLPAALLLLLGCCLAPAARAMTPAQIAPNGAISKSDDIGNGVSCSTESDCHLNGDCSKGACACDAGWTGPTCGQLDLGPVDKAKRPGLSYKNNATWGASPLKGADGKWRVAHVQLHSHCGIFQAWMSNSFVALSVSSGGVGGPYKYERELIGSFSHNPQIRELSDGTFAVFYIGGWKEKQCACSSPDDATKCPAGLLTQGVREGPTGPLGTPSRTPWILCR